MVDVFISYLRNDQAIVAMLARALEAGGRAVWWDAELPPRPSYSEVITGKIEPAKAAIVVWSDCGEIRMGARRGRHGAAPPQARPDRDR
jgi:hypothetical protein